MTHMTHTHSPRFSPDLVPQTLALPTRTLEPGDVLYEAGREASSLYIVTGGVLKAIVPTSVGRDRIADLYGPGDVLGTAALSGETHAETVVAIHDATLVPVDPAQSMNDRRLRDAILAEPRVATAPGPRSDGRR